MLNKQEYIEIIKTGENETVEFKVTFDKEVVESLVAFANTKGGYVFIGVSNKIKLTGIDVGKETIQNWNNQIKQNTQPSIIPDIYTETIKGKNIVIIHIKEFPVKPVSTKGRYYKRVKNSNHQLSLNEVTNFYLQTFNLSWDASPYPNQTLDDLDVDKINKFIKSVNDSGRFRLDENPLLALNKLRLINENKPTGASLLLFATEPLFYNIHIGRFKTPSMIIDDKQITITLFEAVEEAMKIIIGHIHVAF